MGLTAESTARPIEKVPFAPENCFMTSSPSAGATVEQRKIEEMLVSEHLPLVHYAVSDMASKVPRHVSRDDLVSAGMAGVGPAAPPLHPPPGVGFPRPAPPPH